MREGEGGRDRTNLLVKDEAHACGQETGQEVIDPPEEEKKRCRLALRLDNKCHYDPDIKERFQQLEKNRGVR